ncbi:tyrosine-protein phosphatase [Ferruginibacter sp.]
MRSFFLFLFLISTIPDAYTQIADSSQRMVKLKGALNFRDIGGYTAAKGKHVKWGKIYRSAEINNLTAADLDSLQARHISYVMDFRGPAEVSVAMDKLPVGATRISLPAGSENVGGDRSKMMEMMSKANNGDSIMLPFYTNIQSFTDRYKPVFATLLKNNEDSAVLFHCTAGKDRTGISAALILYALGVDEKTIMQDYLASNYYRQAGNEQMRKMLVNNYHIKEDVVDDVMMVKEKYLTATFDTIKAKYGSIDKYLASEMGLSKKSIKKLRAMYLEN